LRIGYEELAGVCRTTARTQNAVAQYHTINAPLESTSVLPGSLFQFSWYHASSFDTLFDKAAAISQVISTRAHVERLVLQAGCMLHQHGA
jgi:hypothetical protein